MRTSWRDSYCWDGADGIVRMLSEGEDPNARDPDGSTSLFPPAREGDVDLLKTLIAAGADVDAHNNSGETPILLAANSGNQAVVRALLESGANALVRDDNGRSPLHVASGLGDHDLIDTLLGLVVEESRGEDDEGVEPKTIWMQNGQRVDLDTRDAGGCTPLHYAAEIEDDHAVVAVGQLIVAGADPNVQDNDGATPLHVAASGACPSAVCALLQHGASANVVDRHGMSPLHRLVCCSPEEDPELRAFAALIDGGADPNAPDHVGQTPLHHAVSADVEDAAFVNALIERGADPDTRNRRARTPLHYAAESGAFGPIVRALIDGGANLNAEDDGRGQTALHEVARRGDAEQAKLLVRGGADVSALDGDGRTPLHVAVDVGNSEVARVLVASGADPYYRSISRGWSPMDEANERVVSPEMVRALVGDPNKRDRNGRTPLHEAAAGTLLNWLKALIQAGADPNVRDKDGRTPLHEAQFNQQCVDVLIAAGADPDTRDKNGNTPEIEQ